MNLQCPNCQKLLTVAEQYAGQLMKCPLCNGTFTVPNLPSANDPLPSPIVSPATSTPTPAAPGAEVYSFKDPAPPAPPAGPWPTTPPPMHEAESKAHMPSHSPSAPSLPLGDYTRSAGFYLSPRVFEWIPSVALLLVFFLLFFQWVTMTAGSYPISWQLGWNTIIGGNPVDTDVENERELQDLPVAVDQAGPSVLMIFYAILYFFVLIATVGCLVLELTNIHLPQLRSIWPWRWGIVAASNIFLFLFLALQSVMSFGLETHVADQCTRLEQAKEKEIKDQSKDAKDLSRKQKKIIAIKTRLAQSAVSRTIWWKLTFWVSLIGAVSAAIMYRLDQRRNLHLPLPRVEMRW